MALWLEANVIPKKQTAKNGSQWYLGRAAHFMQAMQGLVARLFSSLNPNKLVFCTREGPTNVH